MKKIPFFVQTPWVGAIGNMSEEIYYGLLRARRENRKVLFFFPYDLFKPLVFSKYGLGINSELKKIESKYRLFSYNHPISIFGNILLTIGASILILIDMTVGKFYKLPSWFRIPSIGLSKLWCVNKKGKSDFSQEEIVEIKKSINQYLRIDLPDKSIKIGKEVRQKIGIPDDAWFVCIHIRESGYYQKKYNEGVGKKIRNVEPKSYIPLINNIINRGGWVVRLGDSTMTKLPQIDRLIDYPFTRYKSDLMDIYFIRYCKYFVGAQSGIWDVANLFQKTLLMPNSIAEIHVPPPRSDDLLLYKHIYSNKESKYIQLQDIPSFFSKKKIINNNDISFVDNSGEEIEQLVNCYYDAKNCKSDLINADNHLRSILVKNSVNKILKHKSLSEIQKCRIMFQLIGSNGSVIEPIIK